ncbi:MAG: aminoacetone oxidase family FAD-binding enzyme [Bacilli bacterium]|nr:aminoacetone oxidase family FAD-binding enzyme [Bacilli bacterium]
MKRVTFIGGGSAALISSILIKQRDPSIDVFIIEKDKKLGRKLAMTGGGKCNMAPMDDDILAYNLESHDLLKDLYHDINLDSYFTYLSEVGIETKTIKDYGYYPTHESAPQLVKNLTHRVRKLGIHVINDELVDIEIVNHNPSLYKLICKDSTYESEYVVFATGGMNDKMVAILEKLDIYLDGFHNGLCPIKLKENVSNLFGCRFMANVTLKENGKPYKKYFGEVQFKKDGLSGIPILNLSSDILRRFYNDSSLYPQIEKPISGCLDDFEIIVGLPEKYFNDISKKGYGVQSKDFLMKYFKEEYVDYLLCKHNVNPQEIVTSKNELVLSQMMLKESFHVDSFYGQEFSQVTVGGIPLINITKDFENKHIQNTYFVGEMLNVDGYCGGYNLRFTITSSIKCALSILKR